MNESTNDKIIQRLYPYGTIIEHPKTKENCKVIGLITKFDIEYLVNTTKGDVCLYDGKDTFARIVIHHNLELTSEKFKKELDATTVRLMTINSCYYKTILLQIKERAINGFYNITIYNNKLATNIIEKLNSEGFDVETKGEKITIHWCNER